MTTDYQPLTRKRLERRADKILGHKKKNDTFRLERPNG
jgi:hypothetical protein